MAFYGYYSFNGLGTKDDPIILSNPIKGFEGMMWGYHKYFGEGKEYLLKKGKTAYFLVDPSLVSITAPGYNCIKIMITNYDQRTNVESEIIPINKITGQEIAGNIYKRRQVTGKWEGSVGYYEKPLFPSGSYPIKYLIRLTEMGVKDQPITVFWEAKKIGFSSDYLQKAMNEITSLTGVSTIAPAPEQITPTSAPAVPLTETQVTTPSPTVTPTVTPTATQIYTAPEYPISYPSYYESYYEPVSEVQTQETTGVKSLMAGLGGNAFLIIGLLLGGLFFFGKKKGGKKK